MHLLKSTDQWLRRCILCSSSNRSRISFHFYLYHLNKDETTRSSTTMSQTNIQTKREAQTNTSRKANLVRNEQRLGTSRKQIEPGSNFVLPIIIDLNKFSLQVRNTKQENTEKQPKKIIFAYAQPPFLQLVKWARVSKNSSSNKSD